MAPVWACEEPGHTAGGEAEGNALESSPNHPPTPSVGTVFHETGPEAEDPAKPRRAPDSWECALSEAAKFVPAYYPAIDD